MMRKASLASLSEAQIRTLRDAEQIEREVRRQERKSAKSERIARAREVLKTAEATARKPRVLNNAYLKYVRRCPCLCCMIEDNVQSTPTRAAHVRSGYPQDGWPHTGKAQKPDDNRALPLCDMCHTDGNGAQHKSNEREWWKRLGVYPPEACTDLGNAFAVNADPVETIEAIATTARRNRAQEGQ